MCCDVHIIEYDRRHTIALQIEVLPTLRLNSRRIRYLQDLSCDALQDLCHEIVDEGVDDGIARR